MISICQQILTRARVCLAMAALLSLSATVQATQPFLPEPGRLVRPSRDFVPPQLKGMVVDPGDPFRLEFIVDPGQAGPGDLAGAEAMKHVHYFLTALTVPEEEQWVNLSPYEADRMIPASLGRTRMGRDLLAQDYLLKQMTASLMYPEDKIGGEFWRRVYRRAEELYGTREIPVDTFNKVWIVPRQATVFEHTDTVLILDSRLSVMMDADYLAAKEFHREQGGVPDASQTGPSEPPAAQVIRDIILPELEREVNTGRHFAPLRQMYRAMILATWYKTKLASGPLHAAYVDQGKTAGIDHSDIHENGRIYDRYVTAFRKGVYDYVKEDDADGGPAIPRRYFSGGMDMQHRPLQVSRLPAQQELDAVHGDGYWRVGVNVYPARNPRDGIIGAMHDGHGVVYEQMKSRLERIAERYGWGRVFSQLERQRTAADEQRLDKLFELLVGGGLEHWQVLGLQDRIIPVNVPDWRLNGENDRLGGLIVRHNGVLKILFPRARLFAPDAEVMADLLHELLEVTLLEEGMGPEDAHATASEINAVMGLTEQDDIENGLLNGLQAMNGLLDRHLGAAAKLPPARANPLSTEQLTQVNTALAAKREQSIRQIRRRVKSRRTLEAVVREFRGTDIPQGTLRRIRLETADLLAQIRSGALDALESPVALFRLSGAEEWVIHKGRTVQKRTKIQLGEDLMPGYAYDVYLQHRPGEEGFALPEPEDLVDFGAEDVDKIHAVITAGGGLTFVDVSGLVRAMSKEDILSMGRNMEERLRERMQDDRTLSDGISGAAGEPVRRRFLGHELGRMQDEGMIRITRVAWDEVGENILPPLSYVLWEQFADPSFNVRKRAIALLFHLRDRLGLPSVLPIFNAVIDSLSEAEQIDLFDHRTYPFSGMYFMDADESGSLFDVSRYPVVRAVVSLGGWNSKRLWQQFMQQTRLRVLSKDVLGRLSPAFRDKITPMVNDPLIKDGLVIAARLTLAEQRELGRDFLDAYTEQLRLIGRERDGEQDPLIAAAADLRRRWKLDGVVSAADLPAANPGGIDFDPRWMRWQSRDAGAPVRLEVPAAGPPLSIEGLVPEIYRVTPLPSLMPLLSAQDPADEGRLTRRSAAQ